MHAPGDLPDTIPEAIMTVARRAPERIAMQLKQEGAYRPCTYRQFVDQIEGLAAGGGLLFLAFPNPHYS